MCVCVFNVSNCRKEFSIYSSQKVFITNCYTKRSATFLYVLLFSIPPAACNSGFRFVLTVRLKAVREIVYVFLDVRTTHLNVIELGIGLQRAEIVKLNVNDENFNTSSIKFEIYTHIKNDMEYYFSVTLFIQNKLGADEKFHSD